MRYNQKRSSNPGKIFLAVEGTEDIAYYENAIERVVGADSKSYHFFVCNGKDFVLDLMLQLDDNIEPDAKNTIFFIDNDFDGHKGFGERDTLYITEGYSIENSITSESTLGKLLRSEFRCALEGHEAEASLAIEAFSSVMAAYSTQFSAINRCIHAARVTDAFRVKTDKSIKEKLKVEAKTLRFEIDNISAAKDFLNIDIPLSDLEKILNETSCKFSALNPLSSWRGKYIYHVFKEFLAVLAEDRGRKVNRQVFSSRAVITFARDTTSVRLLSSASDISGPLRSFLQKNLALSNAS